MITDPAQTTYSVKYHCSCPAAQGLQRMLKSTNARMHKECTDFGENTISGKSEFNDISLARQGQRYSSCLG